MKRFISTVLSLSILMSTFSSTTYAYYTEEDCRNEDICTIYKSGELNLKNNSLIYIPKEYVANAFEQLVSLENKFNSLKTHSLSQSILCILIGLISSVPTLIQSHKNSKQIKALTEKINNLAQQINDSNEDEINLKLAKEILAYSETKNKLIKNDYLLLILGFIGLIPVIYTSSAIMDKFNSWKRSQMPQNLEQVKNYLNEAIIRKSHITLALCENNEISIQTDYMSFSHHNCGGFKN